MSVAKSSWQGTNWEEGCRNVQELNTWSGMLGLGTYLPTATDHFIIQNHPKFYRHRGTILTNPRLALFRLQPNAASFCDFFKCLFHYWRVMDTLLYAISIMPSAQPLRLSLDQSKLFKTSIVISVISLSEITSAHLNK